MGSDTEHLSAEQLENFVKTGARTSRTSVEDALHVQAKNHIATCELCQMRVQLRQEIEKRVVAVKSEDQVRRGPDCPPEGEWWSLVGGVLPQDRSKELLDHSIQCESCAVLFRRATEDFDDQMTEAESRELAMLTSSRDENQLVLARKLKDAADARRPVEDSSGKQSSRGSWRTLSIRFWVPAIATFAFVCLMVLFGVWRYQSSSVNRLLAQAYVEQRTLELRIPGAGYAPMRQQRGLEGSRLSKPAPLLKAEYLIKEDLATHPNDSDLLAAKGRSELLEWRYDDAIRSLARALEIKPNSPDLLRDLATGYFQRAESEDRPIDYGKSIELLSEAITKNPSDSIAWFNRAVADERLFLYNQAIDDWERYLKIEKDPAWATEARQRLADIREKVKSDKKPSALLKSDPRAAAPILRARANDMATSSEPWSDSLDEEYLDLAIRDWLPQLQVSGDLRRDAAMDAALHALADVLQVHHHDRWLFDLLDVPPSRSWANATDALARAAKANATGDFETARDAGQQAIQDFETARNAAGVERASWEKMYALQRSQQGNLCLLTGGPPLVQTNGKEHPWIQAQLYLDSSICDGMVGKFGEARQVADRAFALVENSGYGNLLLRAIFVDAVEIEPENAGLSWRLYCEGLRHHWAGSYRPFWAYQYYAQMAYFPEENGELGVALAFASEAVSHVAITPNRLLEAIARHRLAVDMDLAGLNGAAREEFKRASGIFLSLPASPTTATFISSAEIYQASLEIQSGQVDSALARLKAARKYLPEVTQYWILQHFYGTLGEAYLKNGDTGEAEQALRAAVNIDEGALQSIRTEQERFQWTLRTEKTYRNLVELFFRNKGDPSGARDIWEWFLSAPLRVRKIAERGDGIDFSNLQGSPSKLPTQLVFPTQQTQIGATTITYAQFPEGLAIWVSNGEELQSKWVPITTDRISKVAESFISKCSDPKSDLGVLREDGRILYEWLVAPIAQEIKPGMPLVFEPDIGLSQVPFGALVMPDGKYLGEQYRIVSSPGAAYVTRLRLSRTFSTNEVVLVVGSPAGTIKDFSDLPPLPDANREAENVAAQFTNALLLVGKNATLAEVKRDLPRVGVFHYAGHAISDGQHVGLLLAASHEDSDSPFESARLLDAAELESMALEGTDLVVLSACATAPGARGIGDPSELVRSFLRLGVPNVIATRWSVDSRATADFMKEFYDRLREKQTVAEAFKDASMEIVSRPFYRHPYYWAAFAVYGRP